MQKVTKISDFQIISRLGQGAFGQVYKIKRRQDGQIYALKKIKTSSMSQRQRLSALNEIRILASYEGQHIIGYKQSFFDIQSESLCIVLQFAQKGDLLHKIQKAHEDGHKIQQSQIWKALVQISKGLNQLHSSKVIHRDLKSANIFIMADGTYKLGDLNISKVLKTQLTKTKAGTPYYTSPQIWNNKPYGSKIDMWSLGCVIYQMAAQRPPFPASSIQELKKKILMGTYTRIPKLYSEQLSQIINCLLKINPLLRPSCKQILSNPIVLKNSQNQFGKLQTKHCKLMKTIKMNIPNWKKINLPKPRYEKKEGSPVNLIKNQSYQQGKSSSLQKPVNKQIKILKEKLNNYIQMQRKSKQKQKIEQIKKVLEQNKSLSRSAKKQRILSVRKISNKLNVEVQQKKRQQFIKAKLPPKPKAGVISPRQQNVSIYLRKIDTIRRQHSKSFDKAYQKISIEIKSKENKQ